MKFNTLLKKTALAAAIATVSFGASAATLTVPTPNVLANEIFGPGSETTGVALPKMVFKAEAGKVSKADETTIKLTLGNEVIFDTSYDSTAAWSTQGIVVKVGGVPLDDTNSKVTAGGTTNNNQITIAITTDGLDMEEIELSGFKVQQLKDLLKRGGVASTDAVVEVRYSEVSDDAVTAKAEDVIVSVDGVVFSETSTEKNRVLLNITDGQKTFTTATGPAAKNDFGPGQDFADLGTFTAKRGVFDGIQARKEDGSLFDLTGSDVVTVDFEADSSLETYKGPGLFLARNAASCSVATDKIAPETISGNTAKFNLTGKITLGEELRLCVEATDKRIEELSNLTATAEVSPYFSKRYTNSKSERLNYGSIGTNGCTVTLFNLPNVNAADNAFLRFTNTSEFSGKVSATVWSQAGDKLERETLVLDSLKPHATAILHTNKAQGTNLDNNVVYLGDSLHNFVANETARSRIVLQGAFPSCEALGLVRSSNGTLVNMTSTVSNTAGNTPAEANGTSNTQN